MHSYGHRLANALLSSGLLPVFVRMSLMRALGFKLAETSCIWSGGYFGSNKVTLGRNVFINVGFYYDGDAELEIMDNVRLGPFVRVLTAGHAIGPSTQRCTIDVIAAPVRIETGSWIGSSVTLMPGVIIAAGCVLAANSVLTASTEPNGLYGGVPARRLKDLEPGGQEAAAGRP